VAVALSANIITGLENAETRIQERMMFSVCLCSFLFIMTSSIFGMPISGTHTVVGALIGAGMVGVGP
jgi:phosphate/sulfate permease